MFAGFDPQRVASFDQTDVDRLMQDAGIVRNRAKIEATISNARVMQEIESLSDLAWGFAPEPGPAPRAATDIPAQTAESKALSKELQRRGFRFVGPTTVYAFMQSMGLVNDHLLGCPTRAAVQPGASGGNSLIS